MNEVYQKLVECYESIKDRIPFAPKVGLILGSGLGTLADEVQQEAIIDYHDIKGFPVSTAPGHKGRFIFTHIDGVATVIMQGRVHYYEGYDMTDVVLPTRLMKMMGADTLFVTNASGGIKLGSKCGELMLITGQISVFVPNPLVGPNISELGVRFPDMSHVYDEDLQQIAREVAAAEHIRLTEGTYVQLTGPSYESPQEIAMLRTLGADAVGMSTVVEAIAANHMGMKIIGISCIANLAAGISPTPLSEQEVIDAGIAAAPQFKKLVCGIISKMK